MKLPHRNSVSITTIAYPGPASADTKRPPATKSRQAGQDLNGGRSAPRGLGARHAGQYWDTLERI